MGLQKSQEKNSGKCLACLCIFNKRTFLKKAFILIDARRGLKEIDINFLEFLFKNKVPFQIILTKVDKLKKQEENDLLQGFNLQINY